MSEISVVICTYRRQRELASCLEALTQQSAMPQEVLVIDNEVSALTRQVVDGFAARLPTRYVAEPQVGLSNARRTGWQVAAGDVVAYIDDDALASADFVRTLAEAFASQPRSVVCVGGRIGLVWPDERPTWVAPWMESFFSALDLGDEPHIMGPTEFAWGCNMAFRKDFLESTDAFSSPLGRTGTVLLSGEDTEIQKAAIARGMARWYEPAAAVSHIVAQERAEPGWLRRRMFWEAASEALIARLETRPTFSERLKLTLQRVRGNETRIARGLGRAVRNRNSQNPFLDVVLIATAGYTWGMFRSIPSSKEQGGQRP